MIIDCPSCSRKLRVPDDLLGKQVKCPTCGYTFLANAAELTPSSPDLPPLGAGSELHGPGLSAPAGSADVTQQFPSPPPSGTQPAASPEQATQLVACPSCDKLIERGVARCPYCGEVPGDAEDGERFYGDAEDRPWEQGDFGTRLDAEPHRGTLILVLGIISLVLFCGGPLGMIIGIFAWVMGQKDMHKMRENQMDPEGMGLTQAGWVCGIIGTIASTLCGLGMLLYFALVFTVVGAFRNAPPPRIQAPPVQAQPPRVTKKPGIRPPPPPPGQFPKK